MKIILKDRTEIHADVIDFLDNTKDIIMVTDYGDDEDEDEFVTTVLIKTIDRIEED